MEAHIRIPEVIGDDDEDIRRAIAAKIRETIASNHKPAGRMRFIWRGL